MNEQMMLRWAVVFNGPNSIYPPVYNPFRSAANRWFFRRGWRNEK